jgi:penicillin G amidase
MFRAAPRALRWSAYAVVALAVLLVLLLVAGVVVVLRPVAQTGGEVDLPGLTAEVEVLRDASGIPQVYADTDADLLRAQGYVHAQERFFEMDVRRHVTSGRLSELFGEDGLETDKMIRTMGWRRVAQQELALLDTETRAALTAYAEGVNAYLESRGTSRIAVEYTLLAATGLSYEPEPWTPVDSLA